MSGATAPFDHVIGISWPRSGHHMLVRLLTLYFGSDFGYCEFHAGVPTVPGLDSCCRSVPCHHRDRIALTKNHDFDLATPQIEGQKYLVQYRDFVPSVVSNFELHVRNGAPDTDISFRAFASMEFGRYRGFMNKWVHSGFGQAQLLLNYADFVSDPATHLARALAWIAPGQPVDAARVAEAVARVDGERIERAQVQALQGVGVHKPRDVTAFRHYDAALFADLERLRLERSEVIDAFVNVLGREPAERNVLAFQCFDSRATLETHLRDSDEYRQRAAAGAGSGNDQESGLT